jgi:hypothetical protein
MRGLVTLALVGLVCGCVCTGGNDFGLGNITVGDATSDTLERYCTPPYILAGEDCCIDSDDNRVCDKDERAPEKPTTSTEPPTTTSEPPTTLPDPYALPTYTVPTTTTLAPSCADGARNQGEEFADCGGPCTGCPVFALGGGWLEHEGYQFRFDRKEGMGQSLKYYIEIKTPDGIDDTRPVSTGESFVDGLRFRVVNYGESTPRVYIRTNMEDLEGLPSGAVLLTVGGQSCRQKAEGMCQRRMGAYNILLINRLENGARIELTGPDGTPRKTDLLGTAKTYSVDRGLVIGGFFDPAHFIQGGYALLYAYTN